MRALQLLQDALQGARGYYPVLAYARPLSEVGIPRVGEGDTDVPKNTASAKGRTAPSWAQKTATQGLPQWALVEAALFATAATNCLPAYAQLPSPKGAG